MDRCIKRAPPSRFRALQGIPKAHRAADSIYKHYDHPESGNNTIGLCSLQAGPSCAMQA
jgi:hypothetical protein